MSSNPKDRTAEAWHQLGFEHGYAGIPQSYPEWFEYVRGYVFGKRFRSQVTELAPILARTKAGDYYVTFPYTGWMLNQDPMGYTETPPHQAAGTDDRGTSPSASIEPERGLDRMD
jgi:hypothetical protein